MEIEWPLRTKGTHQMKLRVGFLCCSVGSYLALVPACGSASPVVVGQTAVATDSSVSREAAPTRAPTASPTPALTPTATSVPPTVPALTLEQRVSRSINDNKNASADGANLDNLTVSFETANAHLHVFVKPNRPPRDTELISNGSALSVIVGKAVWTTYPEVNVMTLAVQKDSGTAIPTTMVSAIYLRETSAHDDYSKYRKTTGDDNKTRLCAADYYSLDRALWKNLGDKGCMLASDGGVNPSIAGKTYIITTASGSISLRSQRQIDLLQYLLAYQTIASPADQNLASFKAFAAANVGVVTAYNFVRNSQDAWTSLGGAARNLDVPPGLEEARAALVGWLQSNADAMGHMAEFLNKGDLEKQRTSLQEIKDGNTALAASVGLLFAALEASGMQPGEAFKLATCDATTHRCELRPPASGVQLFH